MNERIELNTLTPSPQILESIPTPCYVLEQDKLNYNLEILSRVQNLSGAKILLALKGYAFWRRFEKIREILSGSTASGLYEAKLGFEEIGGFKQGKEVCVFSPAYKEVDSLLPFATHIIFNSFHQLARFALRVKEHNKSTEFPISMGLRINPLYSEVETELYNPCARFSRLGITPDAFEKGLQEYGSEILQNIEGLHFHTHCEQDSTALAHTLPHVEKHFGAYFKGLKWLNFGGGHHITRYDYDENLLIKLIQDFKARHHLEVFLEPGEAVGWQVGFLIASVVDIIENEKQIAILDVSASAHMPDCLEMPYRPSIYKVSKGVIEMDKGEGCARYCYRFGAHTCLAGDVIGDFSFDSKIEIGDRVVFCDMLHYTIVKNTTFNGVELPSLGVIEHDKKGKESFKILKTFSFNDYKERN